MYRRLGQTSLSLHSTSKLHRMIYTATHYPSVFISQELSPDLMDFSSFKLESKRVFEQLQTKHVSPEEFKYQLPDQNIPEYAFIGRSNVGKSSLISALLNNKNIVRISKEPGCTRTLHFYAFMKDQTKNIYDSPPSLYLVDLPGYGYAKISQKERQAWTTMIHNYLVARSQPILRRTFVLVDSRRGMKDTDIEMINMLNQHAIPFQIIMTKSDLLKSTAELHRCIQSVFEIITRKVKGSMNVCLPIVHVVSSKNNEGLSTLRENIMEINSYQWNDANTVEEMADMTDMEGVPGMEGISMTGVENIRAGMARRAEMNLQELDMAEKSIDEDDDEGANLEEGLEAPQAVVIKKERGRERKAKDRALNEQLNALYE